MGCGASKIVEQQAVLNNGHTQQVVEKSGVVEKVTEPVASVTKPFEQDKPVSNPPENQTQLPQHQTPGTEEQVSEPEKQVSQPTSLEPGATEPVQKDENKDEPSNEKPAPTYTEESLQEFLQLEEKLSCMESKGVVRQYQTQHKLLVTCYADLQATQKKVEGLKQQTYDCTFY